MTRHRAVKYHPFEVILLILTGIFLPSALAASLDTLPPIYQILDYDELHGNPPLFGEPNKKWNLTGVKNANAEHQSTEIILGKLINRKHHLICSIRELEYLCQQGNDSNRIRINYVGKGTRIPSHWTDLPPLIQPVQFVPYLPVIFLLRDGRIQIRQLVGLKAVQFYALYKDNYLYPLRKFKGKNVPIEYQSQQIPSDAISCFLISLTSEKKFKSIGIRAVKREIAITEIDTTLTIPLNLDSDSIAEFNVFISHGVKNEEMDFFAGTITALIKGKWFRQALIQYGQDGPEGF